MGGGGGNISQIFDEAIASNGFIYTNAQLLQALDKKAGRTTHYHPGFAITSTQLLRAIDELDIGASSEGLKSILGAVYKIADKDTDNITEPVTIEDVGKAVSDLGSDLTSILNDLKATVGDSSKATTATIEDISEIITTYLSVTTVNLLKAVYEKTGKDPETVTGTVTTKDISEAIAEIDVASSLDVYNEHNNEYIAYNISSITRLPEDVSTLKILRVMDCPNINEIPDINSMTSLTTINLSGSTLKNFTAWDTLIGSYIYDGNSHLHPSGLFLLAEQYNLVHITMPDSYTEVGEYAFHICPKLQSISMPGVISVGALSVCGCVSLTSLDLPECKSVGISSFQNDFRLTYVNIHLCTNVEMHAFHFCLFLPSIALPICTSIGEYAFSTCSFLASVVLPDTLSSVGGEAFENSENITTLDIVLRTTGGNNISTMCSSTLVKDSSGYATRFTLRSNSTLNVYLGSELFDEENGVATQDGGWQSFLEGLFSLTKTGINSDWGENITTANLYLNGTGVDEAAVSGYTGYPGIFTIDYDTEQPYA